MKALGYGKGYDYAHDNADGVSGQRHLPPELGDVRFYEPGQRGFERELDARLAHLRKLRGLTQPQLAEELGVSLDMLIYYERRATNPSRHQHHHYLPVKSNSVIFEEKLHHSQVPKESECCRSRCLIHPP